MTRPALTQPQLDLLFHAGVFGLCRVPADAVEDINTLREAGLVVLNEDRCFELTPYGQRQVVVLGGKVTARHMH